MNPNGKAAPLLGQARVWRLFPGLALMRGYRKEWLARDFIAGISVCIVMIPTVIAYSGLMGIPPEVGLHAALVPLVVYALLGSSRQMMVGPDIAIALMILSTIAPLSGGDPHRAAALASGLAMLAGALLILGARANFGAVANFLSKPVLVGYMTGAALILVASQLNKMLGVSLHNTEFFLRLGEMAGKLGQINYATMALGIFLLALVASVRHFAPRVPVALIACTVAVVLSVVFGLPERGVAIVGSVPGGLPVAELPAITLKDLSTLLPAAIGIALLAYTEGVMLARAFAAKNDYEINSNQELTALGVANVATGLFQGFAVTGSQSSTTVNDSAGGRTPLAGLFAAGVMALFITFLTPLIGHVPQVALAAILIYAGFGLVDFKGMFRIYRYYPRSAMVAAITTITALAAGVVTGILFGVALSLMGLIHRISNPPDAVLSEVPGHGFHDVGETDAKPVVPGLIAYRFYAPLLFSNVGHLLARVRHLVAAESGELRWFLLDAQAITDIDVTAVEALHSLREELQRQGVCLKIAHANRPLRALLERTGLAAEIGHDCFFASVHECVEAFESRTEPGAVQPK